MNANCVSKKMSRKSHLILFLVVKEKKHIFLSAAHVRRRAGICAIFRRLLAQTHSQQRYDFRILWHELIHLIVTAMFASNEINAEIVVAILQMIIIEHQNKVKNNRTELWNCVSICR